VQATWFALGLGLAAVVIEALADQHSACSRAAPRCHEQALVCAGCAHPPRDGRRPGLDAGRAGTPFAVLAIANSRSPVARVQGSVSASRIGDRERRRAGRLGATFVILLTALRRARLAASAQMRRARPRGRRPSSRFHDCGASPRARWATRGWPRTRSGSSCGSWSHFASTVAIAAQAWSAARSARATSMLPALGRRLLRFLGALRRGRRQLSQPATT
jgi:hypothetical protein